MAAQQKKPYELDMCHGPLMGKILTFTLPLVISGMLQLLFNAADVIVVGRFAGSESLAAVGSTGPLVNLMVNLFIGFSIGANVVVARAYGANNRRDISETVHTAMLMSVMCGIFLILVGIPLAKPLLKLMASPENVIDLSALYLKIYFLGMPATLVYDFGSAILRAAGDTRRPLYYLSAAGVINVVLNLIFVTVFHMGVAGVALATIISQTVSAVLIVISLTKESGALKLNLKKLRITYSKFRQIIRIGLPTGINSMMFSLSNMVLQSAINSFGSDTMAGNAAASNIEGFIYVAMNAFSQAAVSFTGQNIGAKEYKRVKRIFSLCTLFVVVTAAVLGVITLLSGRVLLEIFSSSPQVIDEGYTRLLYICSTYFLCGIMDVAGGVLRGMGYSVIPMIVSLVGVCGFRLVWVATIFNAHRSTGTLFLSYPITWALTFVTLFIFFLTAYKKLLKTA